MELLPIVVAGVAAGAILLIFLGLTGRSPVDPVQARLTQLGAMQAKNLEELELQQPFLERTLRPLAPRSPGRCLADGQQLVPGEGRETPRAGRQPRQPAVADWLGVKAVGAVVGAIIFILLFVDRRRHEAADPAQLRDGPWSASCSATPAGVLARRSRCASASTRSCSRSRTRSTC